MDNITLALIKAIAGNSGGGSVTPGKDGVGISKIEKTDTQGLVDTYTISYTNGTTTTFTVTNGQDGQDGADGTNGTPGKDGQNGITPTIGENGNWYLGDEDTGKPSRGEKGDKGDTGNTGPAGADGAPGTNGQDGSPGEDGFSPTIVENENNDESTYKLDITTKTGSFTTPNLKSSGEGASDYNNLTNKPKLNEVEISGDKTASDYGLPTIHYMENSDNPFILSEAEIGIYIFSSSSFTMKGFAESQESDTCEPIDRRLIVFKKYEEGMGRYDLVAYYLNDDLSISTLAVTDQYNTGLSGTNIAYNGPIVSATGVETITQQWTFNQLPVSSVEPTANDQLVNKAYVDSLASMGGGGTGTSDYTALSNKPKINNVEVTGELTSSDIGVVGVDQGTDNAFKYMRVNNQGKLEPYTLHNSDTPSRVYICDTTTKLEDIYNLLTDPNWDFGLFRENETDGENRWVKYIVSSATKKTVDSAEVYTVICSPVIFNFDSGAETFKIMVATGSGSTTIGSCREFREISFQPKTDNVLQTEDKTIVGAINELLEKINALTPVSGQSLLTVPNEV